MSRPPLVVWDNSTFVKVYPELKAGDIIATRLCLKTNEEHILLDLVDRGVQLIPSATAQLASRSKVFQTRIFSSFTIPGSRVVYNTQSLLDTISNYHENGGEKVVVKHDRKNAGLGIFLFNSIEDVYALAANNSLPFPFVLQPFLQSSYDLRVIILGDYQESYQRSNPHNFRNNLHCGGKATPCELSDHQKQFCSQIMSRGGFSYGHLDLIVTDDGGLHLLEINLRGGLRGAKITTDEYKNRIRQLHHEMVDQLETAQ